MKVFISWSGEQSKKVGEVLRDWLPGVLQLVTPYFTPSDIEKGTRWATEISRELSESQIGILCLTRENIQSNWILFEAGALSKSLERSHVCPVLFGITNADLSGPLKQFQTTEFQKRDMTRLLGVINGQLGENKLSQKTLEMVFDKWWTDLETKINQILSGTDDPKDPVRSDRELLEEILHLSRSASRHSRRLGLPSPLILDLLNRYIELHDFEIKEEGSYQDTLDYLQKMHGSVAFISKRYKGMSEQLDELVKRFNNLSYSVLERGEEDE